ncbi:hypothetical protein CCO03_01605 [Comamonas serinivorans]|uniref:Probable membrane transporter protein n=1 Tax=Comamonas serinivorans TaxID=1082851 RepID=A0A1Y0EJU4_9BURK|nr:TSUP family transporter [Comamonas serinivorans]ARU03552.1 hypothetical protein CCO03_01605 [Comamonas serinivorans]
MELFIVSLASLLAGAIDSIVGGGGLILVPALFAVYPSAAPPTLLGTNKSASVWGTAFATWQYARRVQISWPVMLPAFGAALLGSLAGAYTVTVINPDFLRKALPLILLAVLAYTLWQKKLGTDHRPSGNLTRQRTLACAIGLVIGWYDGFFGPGTGSFFIFLFVRLLGYDFLNASASAKLLNVATNLAAIALFASKGYIWWHVGLTMAVANVAGSLLGARLALRYGSGFVRWVFVLVVSLLILKTGLDAIRTW